MHRYLRSVGLKSLDSKKKVREYLDEIIAHPDTARIIQEGRDENLAVLTKKLTEKTGIAVCGEYEDDQKFRMDSYFPYIIGQEISTEAGCMVTRQSGSDMYEGMCEDYRLGVSLIFFLTNFMQMKDGKNPYRRIKNVAFAALSDEGRILLPVRKTRSEREKERVSAAERGKMIEEAKDGNQEAMESLTMEEVTLYNNINRRVRREDLYSIIDTFFMPSGMECDQYGVMGLITKVEEWKNSVTGEEGFFLRLECNDMPFVVSIQKEDLLGEPKAGRRFKGNIWMQGTANFE